MKPRVLACLCLIALAITSCGGTEPETSSPSDDAPAGFEDSYENAEAYPQFISSEVVVGKNRFLVGLLDENDAPIGTPKITVSIAFYDLQSDDSQPTERADMDFVPVEQGSRGVYVTYPTFEHAGTWGAEVTIRGPSLHEALKGSFEVRESGTTPALGAEAPPSETPTAADADLSAISSDPHPDPRFYEKSVAEALADGDPFVLAFATPKFCQTASCGPALEIVKGVAKDYREVTFIHVEPYENLNEIGNVVPAVEEWGLPSEPYIFVVDGKGRIAAKFEGVVGKEELREALDAL